jgi:hypothetical protein
LLSEALNVGEGAWCSKSSNDAAIEPLSYMSSILAVERCMDTEDFNALVLSNCIAEW